MKATTGSRYKPSSARSNRVCDGARAFGRTLIKSQRVSQLPDARGSILLRVKTRITHNDFNAAPAPIDGRCEDSASALLFKPDKVH
jgi:hypothetical protein